MRKPRTADDIRCDTLVDRQIHPELFDALSEISDPRRRAAFLRICAEKYILLQKYQLQQTIAQQGPEIHGGTYHGLRGKCHSPSPALTVTNAVSAGEATKKPGDHDGLPLDGATNSTPAQPGSMHPPVARRGSENTDSAGPPALTTSPMVSAKIAGSAVLAGALGDRTPGLS